MPVCFNVHITGEFPIFGVTVDAVVWDSLEARGIYKRLAKWRIPLCHLLLLVFQRGDLVRRRRESNFYDCCMEEAYEGGLDVIVKDVSGRRSQGLSEVGIVCILESILELYAPFLAAFLGGSKTGMESSTAKNVPSKPIVVS